MFQDFCFFVKKAKTTPKTTAKIGNKNLFIIKITTQKQGIIKSQLLAYLKIMINRLDVFISNFLNL